MSWSFNGRGQTETSGSPLKNLTDPFVVATETVTLGVHITGRMTSVIDWIPVDKDGKQMPFTVISNTGTTNTSGSCSDQLYACYTRNGTYFRVKNTLRDCNYADDANQGTSFRDLDTNLRVRYVDPNYVGQYPYYKLRVLQKGAETHTTTIGFAVIVGKLDKGSWKVVKSLQANG